MSHTWIGTDVAEYSACLVCGGMWVDTDPRSVTSLMTGLNGEPAVSCTRDTDQCHHYNGECPRPSDEACTIKTDCNCLHCDS